MLRQSFPKSLHRTQKPSLIGKGFSRNVTPYIICSSHIDCLKKAVARWHQKRAHLFASLPYCRWSIKDHLGPHVLTSFIINVFLDFLKVFTLLCSVRNNKRQQYELQICFDNARHMTLTLLLYSKSFFMAKVCSLIFVYNYLAFFRK